MTKIYNTLFLCTGNSARSILAEAVLDRLGGGHFKAYSAGSFSRGEVNPHAIALLERTKLPTADLRSKPWDEFDRSKNPNAPALDFVITVCDDAAGAVCLVWPGLPTTAHWGLPDPAKVEGTEEEIARAFSDAYRQLSNRISIFLSLPIAGLDRLSLQNRMKEIGQDGLD